MPMEHLNGAMQWERWTHGIGAEERGLGQSQIWEPLCTMGQMRTYRELWRAGREEGQSQETRINIKGADRGRGWRGDWAGVVGKPEENKIKSRESSKWRSTVSEARKRPCSHWIPQQASRWSCGDFSLLGSFLHSHTLIIPLDQKISHLHFKPGPICMESICGSGGGGEEMLPKDCYILFKKANSITDLKSTLQT